MQTSFDKNVYYYESFHSAQLCSLVRVTVHEYFLGGELREKSAKRPKLYLYLAK